MSSERRTASRFKVAVEVSLESDAGKFAALTGDMSRGGAFLPTFKEVPTGTSIDLVISLPSGQEIKATGAVRWCGKTPAGQGLGISFDDMSPEHRMMFDKFCETHESNEKK
jgi:uncharacterized protein (TIGR02266 family)